MPKKIFTEKEKQDIIKKYQNDKISAKRIGEEYNTSAPTILKNLRNWNIPINSKTLDLTNQKFGELIVLKPAPSRNDRYTRWICKCSCGKIVEIRTDYLTSKHTTSCGHIKKEYFNDLDLIGNRFGKLVVIGNVPPDSKKCKCDCGNITVVKTTSLTDGNTQSCGCLKSKGELKINSILNELNIDFQTQYSFSDCRFPDTKRLAYFDYCIFDDNHNIKCLIEYDGIQHEIGWSQKEESLNKIKAKDAFKSYYCYSNNISLIRISYKDYNKLNSEYLLNLINNNEN